tara:strand:- start:225 stop:575 length:351 start_codon:yes stop_codon:yes gene_type:complete
MSKNAELLEYTQTRNLDTIKSEYTMWEEHKFDNCTYVFGLIYEEGVWIAENFNNLELPRLPSSFEDLQEFWNLVNKEIERMKSLETLFTGDQLLMQTKLLSDLGALLLQMHIKEQM